MKEVSAMNASVWRGIGLLAGAGVCAALAQACGADHHVVAPPADNCHPANDNDLGGACSTKVTAAGTWTLDQSDPMSVRHCCLKAPTSARR
jgi:hypothetical protein